jgi:Zn-dependent protease with chaperone function
MMRAPSNEAHVSSLVTFYAHALHVKAPRVRFVRTSPGPCYEALFNRIEIDERTLALPDAVLALIVAHEVAHATQRRSMLLDLAWTGIGTACLLSIPCYVFAISSDDDIWRVTAPGACFVLIWMACVKLLRARARKRAAAFELDADAKAAQLCGTAHALQALESMALRVRIEPMRLDAMRARFLGEIAREQNVVR